jgi:CHRD domain-containing protein
MKRLVFCGALLGAFVLVAGAASFALADGGKSQFRASALVGYEENPDISTVARGRFEVSIDDDDETISYRLSYQRLEGGVQQAHVHFAKRGVNGGITLFLCSNLGNGPAGTPECPQTGTVQRTVEAAAIVAPGVTAGTPAGQGLEAGNFDEFVAALRAGRLYANVHSEKWPGGEIRAQIDDRGKD